MTLDYDNYLLYQFELSWEIDRSVPARRGPYGLLYKSYGGWTVCIHRDRYKLMFKHGKPKRMRKAK